MVTDNFNSFAMVSLIKIFKNILKLEQTVGQERKNATFDCIMGSFLKGVHQKNEEIKYFRFFGSNINSHTKITKSEEVFLKQYACLDE